ncbi:hypothetical protein [Nonomuraea endophytica]|uniref:Integral membrane protein n=1 Tax=Nonomuraea endophytica TaxID=714136 RepID=A0A7W8A2Q0_9ACTN|nr:hypothetical protein [Nonomuraea endophytica]MBB5078418.1 hypothetical protein [Nonomuraea endophytica]
MADMRPLRDELQATLDARRDLGPEYEQALVESFVERLDATIAARVRAELDIHGPRPGKNHKSSTSALIPIALGSLGLSIPLTAIAASAAGPAGLVMAWLAIITVNIVASVAIMRGR